MKLKNMRRTLLRRGMGKTILVITFLLSLLLPGCSQERDTAGSYAEVIPRRADASQGSAIQNIPGKENTLREACRDYFLIGAQIDPVSFFIYDEILPKHFSVITAGNEMSWAKIGFKNEYDYTKIDKVVEYAMLHNLRVSWDGIVSGINTPPWVFYDAGQQSASKELLFKRMEEYITGVMTRYRGSVYCWDVIKDAAPTSENIWYGTTGEEYIKRAFQYARKAGPDVQLFYRDNNLFDREKREKVLKMIKNMNSQEVLVDGISLEGRWYINEPSESSIKEAMKDFADSGLKVRLTNFDISIYDSPVDKGKDLLTDREIDRQINRYKEVVTLLKQYKGVIAEISFSGVADNDVSKSQQKDWPLLFDINNQPKKAMAEILNHKE